MTATTTIKAIYLGNFAATDVHEGDSNSENAEFLVGTVRDHTQMQLTTITSYDKDHDGVTEDDDCNPYGDNIAYNLGSGSVTTKTDSSFEANVELTLADGAVRTVKVVAFQQQNGDLFISDLYNHGTLDNLAISKVEITEITGTDFNGWYTNQSTDNTTITAPLVAKDGYVEGNNTDNLIDAAYTGDPEGDRVDANDAILPGQTGNQDVILAFDGDDTVKAGDADDTVYAGGGKDSVEGGDGNDTIYGDSDLAGSASDTTTIVRESFEWDRLPDPSGDNSQIDHGDHLTGAVQDTGNVKVTFAVIGASDDAETEFATNTQKVHSITDDGAPVNPNSSLSSELDDDGDCATYRWTFDQAVTNVSFRINDIDYSSEVTIKAYDAAGNLVPISTQNGSKISAYNRDGVGGNEQLESNSGDLSSNPADSTPDYSSLVNIAGPIVRLDITHRMDDDLSNGDAGINITDIYFDAVAGEAVGGGDADDDTLLGGAGDDAILGEGGDDLIKGGAGDDALDGGIGNDTIYGDDSGTADPAAAQITIVSEAGLYNGGLLVEITDGATGAVTVQTLTSSYDASIGAVYNVALDAKDSIRVGITSPEGTFWSNTVNTKATAVDADSARLSFEDFANLGDKDFNDLVVDVVLTGDVTLQLPGGQSINPDPNGSVSALAGNDSIIGGDGDDLIYGNGGDDTLAGGIGHDTIYGDDSGTGSGTGTGDLNQIINGSFEDVTGLTSTGYGYVGTGAIVGWTTTDAHDQIDIHNDNRDGQVATDGSNWLDLEASPGNIRVGQTVDGLVDGETYALTFDVSDSKHLTSSGADENLVKVYWGGELVATIDPSNVSESNFQTVSLNLVAGAGNGSDRLEFEGTGKEDNFGAVIDKVSLVPTTEAGIAAAQGGVAGNDDITGGDGDDVVFGNGGNDTIAGGAGADSLSGNDGRDLFIGGNAGDAVDGGTGGDDVDVLDLTGVGPTRIIDQTTDADGDSTSGTVEFLDGTGAVTGTMTFAEIEQILRDNNAPVANDDSATVEEDGSVDIPVLGNDTDGDGDTLTVTSATSPNGTVTVNPNGTLTFVPAPDFNGPTTITYTVSDGQGGSDTATVNVDVTPVNDAPVANDDSDTTPFQTSITVNVLANDTDVDGDTLSVTGATVPAAQGSVVVNGDNTLTFTPATGFEGVAQITYTISDGAGGTDTALLSITVEENPLDGIVEGTAAGEFIGTNSPLNPGFTYTGDPEGDLVDSNDEILPGEGPNDDIIQAGGGNDTVDAGLGNDDVDAGTGDDSVLGGEGDDSLLGGDGADELIGDAGDDTLTGELGDDTLRGGLGDDLIDGGEGNESVRANEGNDTITGGAGDDTLRGGEDNDTVDGGADNDELYGGLGDDSVTGGDGDDEVRGNEGADTLDGGAGADLIVSDDPGDLNDYVTFLGVPVDPNPNDNRDSVTGGDGNDTIQTGDDADTVYGDGGDDSIDSGIDADEVYGGDGNDHIDANLGSDYVEGNAGDDTIIAGIDAFSDYTGDDPNLPNPFLLDPVTGLPVVTDPNRDDGRDTVYGGTGNDSIVTGDDADVIYGEADNDTIDAGIDDDLVDGGIGDDSIIGSHGSDTILGQDGNDFINAGGSYYLGQVDDSSDPVPENGRDLVDGGAGNDTIFGEDDDDTLLGGTGDDVIDGGLDEDSIEGGEGNDSLAGGDGRDTVLGGVGDDTIDGGLNADSLVGGDGDDLISDDNGADTLLGGDGNDTLISGTGNDSLDGGLGDDSILASSGRDTITGGDGNDTIDGNLGEDVIDGGAGDDMITSGDDSDIVDGGTGNDTIAGGNAADILTGGDDRDTFIGGTNGDEIDGSFGGDDFDTLDLRGAAPKDGTLNVTITGPDSNGNGSNGFVTYRDVNGNVTATFNFAEIEEIIPCFTPGTLIATPKGERPVEDLKVGDKVITRDNGLQEIRWIGAKPLTGMDIARNPALKPVLIKAGSLGNGLPERDTLYSPNHRVLINNEKTALYFDEREVLVAAKHLVGAPGVHEVDVMGTTYIHFMFDHHEVVLSNGSWTESFQPGDMSLKGVGEAQRSEIFELFPELRTQDGVQDYQSARRSLKKHEAKLLLK